MAQVTVDGRPVARLDVEPTSAAGATPLLCLHGWTGSKEDWQPVVGPLAADRRVVAVDLPGHAGSPGPPEQAGHSLSALSGWVLRLLDALGLNEVHLVGHSLGGLLAQRVAAAASQRLASLVLIDTGLGALREEAAEHVASIAVTARDQGLAAAWQESLRINQEVRDLPVETGPLADAVRRRFLEQSVAALVAGARSLLSSAPLGAFLRGIDVPVLVVSGDRDDVWTLDEQTRLAEAVRGARHAVLRDCGHTPMQQAPAALVRVLSAFLASAEPSRPAG